MLGSAKSKAANYLAVPSFIIAPAVAQATQALLSDLRRVHATLDAEYKAVVDQRTALNSEYEAVNYIPATVKGLPIRDDTDIDFEVGKKNATMRAAAAKAQRKNEKIKVKQEELEAQGSILAAKARRVKTLLTIVDSAAGMPLLFDAAAILLTHTAEEQILFLNVLTRDKSFTFDNGAYTSSDVRLLDSLLFKGEPVAIIH